MNYQSTAIRYPAEVPDYAFQSVSDQASNAVMTKDEPGLYQVIFVKAGDEYHQLGVQPLPLTETAFLSKVLQVSLPGVFTQLLTGSLADKAVIDSLKQAIDPGVVTYRATFPFKALHVRDGVPAINKIIGARMQFLTPHHQDEQTGK